MRGLHDGLDISEELQARSFLEATFERWGQVDVLVGNAGYRLQAVLQDERG